MSVTKVLCFLPGPGTPRPGPVDLIATGLHSVCRLCGLREPHTPAVLLRATALELAILAGHLLLYPTGILPERAPVGPPRPASAAPADPGDGTGKSARSAGRTEGTGRTAGTGGRRAGTAPAARTAPDPVRGAEGAGNARPAVEAAGAGSTRSRGSGNGGSTGAGPARATPAGTAGSGADTAKTPRGRPGGRSGGAPAAGSAARPGAGTRSAPGADRAPGTGSDSTGRAGEAGAATRRSCPGRPRTATGAVRKGRGSGTAPPPGGRAAGTDTAGGKAAGPATGRETEGPVPGGGPATLPGASAGKNGAGRTDGTDGARPPVIMLHGFVDNRSVFVLLRRSLARHGWGRVECLNYSPLTADIRAAADLLGRHVEDLCERSGSARVDLVGHSLGGLIGRYYVQRLGGDRRVRTLITLGTPHAGTTVARLAGAHPVARQMRPDSPVIEELAGPTPGCRTRFVSFWSDLDPLMSPVETARLDHPDLLAENIRVSGIGHLALPVHPAVASRIREVLLDKDPARPGRGGATAA
jgi:pimeloyl-ACP methyl ester carboxylesterase